MINRWDESEKRKERLLNSIKTWDGKAQLPRELIFEIVHHVITEYARQEKIEFEDTLEGFMKLLHSCTWDCDVVKDARETDERQMFFFTFCMLYAGIEIRRHGSQENSARLGIRKYNDKQIEAHLKLYRGEISKEEFRRQENEARYPTVEDKKQLLESRMDEGIEIDTQRAREILKGYEDGPEVYKILRVAVYESVGKTRMDVAYIEKILDEKVKELLKRGRISVKEYTKIKKIVKRNHPC